MRYDRDHKARTREKVLDEAAALVREAGPDGLAITAVMARAGLTHGGFYAHFASRDDLLAETVSHMVARRALAMRADDEAAAEAATGADLDPRRTLRRYVRAYLSWAHCEGAAGGCPLPVLAGAAGHLPPAARARYEAAFEALVRALASAMRRLGTDAERVAALAPALTVQLIGAVAVARGLGDRPRAEALLAGVRADVLARLGLADPAAPAARPA